MATPPSASRPRPLSPHLQVYRPQLTSVMSISHRATGVFLALGAVAFVWWLVALASGPDAFDTVVRCATSWLGQLFIFGWAVSFYYHLWNGIRHLAWDVGRGLEIHNVYRSGTAVLIATAVSVVLTYALVLL